MSVTAIFDGAIFDSAIFDTGAAVQASKGGIWWYPHKEEVYDHAADVRATLREILAPVPAYEIARAEARLERQLPARATKPIDIRPLVEQIAREVRAKWDAQNDDEAAVMLLLN